MATQQGGRELPGRFSFALLSGQAALLEAAACGLLVLLTRLPLRTRHLLNWDAAQFALGMSHFDVVHHQPHPPGYIGYIALGRLLTAIWADPNTALVALSVLGEVFGVGAAYLFARHLFGRRAALVTALALTVSPLYWYYGEAANTYALEPLLTLAVAWFAWRTWNGDRGSAVPLGLALAAAGAVRPSTQVLLAPLAGLALLRLRERKAAALAVAASGLATVAWLAPLLLLSGGVDAYLHASTALGSEVTTSTAIWEAGLPGLATTSDAVLRGTVWELGGFAVVAVFGLLAAPLLGRSRLGLPAGWGWFCLAWTLPGLLTFLLVHIGQVAYVQLLTPAVFLSLGPAATAAARAIGRPGALPVVTAAGAAASLALFALPPQQSLAGQLRRHDAWVEELSGAVRAFDPEHTVLVADAYGVGSYRTAQVYLPEYHRIGVARDRHGYAGEIFGDVYTPERFDGAAPLTAPPGTETYVFIDRSVVQELVGDPERMREVRFPDGSRIYVWTGPRPELHDGLIWLGPPPGPQERRGLQP